MKIKFKTVNLPTGYNNLSVQDQHAITDRLLRAYRCFSCAFCTGKTLENYCVSCDNIVDIIAGVRVELARNSRGYTVITVYPLFDYRTYTRYARIAHNRVYVRISQVSGNARARIPLIVPPIDISVAISRDGNLSFPDGILRLPSGYLLTDAIASVIS